MEAANLRTFAEAAVLRHREPARQAAGRISELRSNSGGPVAEPGVISAKVRVAIGADWHQIVEKVRLRIVWDSFWRLYRRNRGVLLVTLGRWPEPVIE